MSKLYYPVLILSSILLSVNTIKGQTAYPKEYEKGIAALSEGKTGTAEKFFKESISSNKDAGSYYQLGKLQLNEGTHEGRNRALDNFKQAALREPGNFNYRIDYCSILEQFASGMAIPEYEKMAEDFPNNPIPWVRMGHIYLKGYNDYKNSKKIGMEFEALYDFKLKDVARKDYLEAERCFTEALKREPVNIEALYYLGRLYENSGNERKAALNIKKITGIEPSNKEAHLLLGMLYHRLEEEENAEMEFRNALNLMSFNEREDYEYNSVLKILWPLYGEQLEKMDRREIEQSIARFWKVNNPLLLSKANVRLLEHYSRMVYANLYFGVPKHGIEGWKTDRGEVLLRYGIPKMRSSTRAGIVGESTFTSRNDVWYYSGYSFSFDDYAMSGNFKLSWERGGRFVSNRRSNEYSFQNFENMKKVNIQSYVPLKKQFTVNKEIYFFGSLDEKERNKRDAYIAYQLPVLDSAGRLLKEIPAFEAGVFLFDRGFNTVFEKRINYDSISCAGIIQSPENGSKVDNVKLNFNADTLSLAFEMRKRADSSFYSYHSITGRPGISSDKVDMSDILLAYDVEQGNPIPGAINRNGTYILPRVVKEFTNTDIVYLYYEAYNLSREGDEDTDFEQVITLQKQKEEGEVKGLFSFISDLGNLIFGSDSKISLTSTYHTKERNPQQYIQLDLSKLPKGNYELTVEIHDKKSDGRKEKKIGFTII